SCDLTQGIARHNGVCTAGAGGRGSRAIGAGAAWEGQVLAWVDQVRSETVCLHETRNGDATVLSSDTAECVSAFDGVVCVSWCDTGYRYACESREAGNANFHGAHAATALLEFLGCDPFAATSVNH